MIAGKRREQQPKPRREGADAQAPGDAGSQGIVRDQRGQEQPADKKRAQQASKSEPDGSRSR